MAIDGDIYKDYEDGCSLEGKFNNRFDAAAAAAVGNAILAVQGRYWRDSNKWCEMQMWIETCNYFVCKLKEAINHLLSHSLVE